MNVPEKLIEPGPDRKKRLAADSALALVAVIWGSAFVVQRIASAEVGTFLFNGARFILGALVLIPVSRLGFASLGRDRKPSRIEALGIVLAGIILLGGAAFQQAGLRYTTAGNAGFITGLYVVFIPLILAVVFRQTPRPAIWLGAIMAATGLFLLSTGGSLTFNPGDLLELIGALFWASHVILIGRLVSRVNVMRVVIGQYLVCGLLSLAVGLAITGESLPILWESRWAVAYTGILSVGVGYTLQAAAQREAPPADAAIILSMEAVFAALFGWLFLDERLSFIQLAGCAIMLTGMLLAQVDALQAKPGRRKRGLKPYG